MPEPTRRITPAEVLAAYAATGLRPVNLTWCNPGFSCGCPLTALWAAERGASVTTSHFGPDDVGEDIEAWADERYGSDYAYSFRDAVDGEPVEHVTCEREHQGYADGLAVRAALWPETKGAVDAAK